MSRQRSDEEFAIGLVLAVIVLAVSIWAGAWTETVSVVISDRWWVTETRVTYETPDANGNSLTHTRCRATYDGRQLPLSWPPTPCEPRRGDTVRHTETCYLSWRAVADLEGEDRSGVGAFACDRWYDAGPGTLAELTLGLMGGVRGITPLTGR